MTLARSRNYLPERRTKYHSIDCDVTQIGIERFFENIKNGINIEDNRQDVNKPTHTRNAIAGGRVIDRRSQCEHVVGNPEYGC